MPDETYETIRVDESRDDVAVITFDRPEVRNALDQEMVRELHRALDDLAAREVPVLVFRGAGEKAFVAGADIAELLERDHADALRSINSALFRRIEEYPWPTIAAVRGYALGGGCELAMACDVRVAGESAKLGQPEVSLGIMPAAGGTYRLPRLVGLGKAKELIFTGTIIDAEEARRIGLVNQVVPDAEVLDAALEMAGSIAEQAPLALRLAKAALDENAGEGSGRTLESIAQAILFDSEEKRSRMQAFLDRRT